MVISLDRLTSDWDNTRSLGLYECLLVAARCAFWPLSWPTLHHPPPYTGIRFEYIFPSDALVRRISPCVSSPSLIKGSTPALGTNCNLFVYLWRLLTVKLVS